MRTVLGKVSIAPGQIGVVKLDSASVASATSLVIFFGNAADKYEEIHAIFHSIEKPSSNSSTPFLIVSTNGATFETVGAYGSSWIQWTATIAMTASGSVNGTGIGLTGPTALNVATASGINAECHVRVLHPTRTSKAPIFWDWHFLNSASSPAHSKGSGFFASGPIAGIALTTNGVTTYTGQVDLYGVGLKN